MEETKKARFSAGRLTFAVRHELWDGNIQDHPDQGVAMLGARCLRVGVTAKSEDVQEQ